MEPPLDPSVAWTPLGDEQVSNDVLPRLADRAPQFLVGSAVAGARCARLPFYEDHVLVEIQFESDRGPERVLGLQGPDETYWLDGTSTPLHQTNEAEALELTEATLYDYIRFFFYFVRADSGSFVLIESKTDLRLAEPEHDGGSEVDGSELRARLESMRSRLTPLTMRELDEEGRWVVECSVAFDGGFFGATLAVSTDGLVDMTDDDPIGALDGVSAPQYRQLEIPAQTPEEEDPAAAPPPVELIVGQLPEEPEDLPRDRDVTQAIVTVLLEDAFKARDGAADSHTLLQHFNAETSGGTPLEQLTRLVSRSMPVIVIESDIPFVEDFVAGLIDGPNRVVSGGAVARAAVWVHDEVRLVVDFSDPNIKLHLLSFHAYGGMWDAERTAHELALGDAAVLIGCERLADVPDALTRIVDQKLTFPRIDRNRFARIFERVFHAKPTPGWDVPGADWTRYLFPVDFHIPYKMKLSADEALPFLERRVKDRLDDVTPKGLGLDDLHGLGEAKQICEDLLTDIHAAQADKIPWASVDRGVLLVGDPGTGKTTLARALANECGIKFVTASAASWQSAGHLGEHLRAMRADFTEARRFAPAILFIDELDSIGSRESFVGQNASYNVQVVNALLEQIQGINSGEDQVIVIGATNYVENIDPALIRAGRLDQVVRLPRPNIAALEKIFEKHLERHRKAKNVARDVEARTLAELAWGLTGADVEFFVRGAARRARRAGRKIKQEDLVAEVTRRPRRSDSAPQLTKEQIRRVAVHEAGHTVARLVSSTRGEDLTFVTIVPRMDGSLGFVATAPLDGHVATRRTLLERLETVLAGRAAEEIVFGADEIGAGAGGSSADSDLAGATRLAEHIVCQSGLGDDGELHWTAVPTPAQEKQIRSLLGKSYKSIVARLEDHRDLLDRIVEVLEDKQELSGTELRQLLAKESQLAATPVSS